EFVWEVMLRGKQRVLWPNHCLIPSKKTPGLILFDMNI
ncbi:uncharacterized protein METZ01_LOCUS328887, partial [marine metagenome]